MKMTAPWETSAYWLRVGYQRGRPVNLPRGKRAPLPDVDQDPMVLDVPVVANFGGGVNSTAFLIEWVRAGHRLDLVVFSDTGGERPETYDHVGYFSWWLVQQGAPPVTIVRYHKRDGTPVTLENRSLTTKRLPSLAYGFKKCSQRFKRDPVIRYLNNWQPAKGTWLSGRRVIQLIGYDADEPHRMKRQQEREAELKGKLEAALTGDVKLVRDRTLTDARKFLFRYPLIETDYGREECIEVCEEVLNYKPGKSSCFFCPACKPVEIRDLAKKHPNLLARALAIETNAESIAGHRPKLGRWRHWGDLVEKAFVTESNAAPEVACECID